MHCSNDVLLRIIHELGNAISDRHGKEHSSLICNKRIALLVTSGSKNSPHGVAVTLLWDRKLIQSDSEPSEKPLPVL
jgi:hypothetical protein